MKKKTRYVNVRFKTGFKVIINNIPFNPYVIRNFSRDSYSKNASNCAFCSRLGITSIRSKYHFIYTRWKCDRIKNGVKVPGVNEGDEERGGGGGEEKKMFSHSALQALYQKAAYNGIWKWRSCKNGRAITKCLLWKLILHAGSMKRD